MARLSNFAWASLDVDPILEMTPPSAMDQRRSLPRDRFPSLLANLKPQVYHDPSTRGLGPHAIRTIAWSPTGHWIATGAGDRTLRVWNPDRVSIKNSTELRGHTGPIERVAWNPTKEAELASCSADGTVRFWDVRTKNCNAEVKLGGEGFTVTWSPDGTNVVAGRKDDTLVPIYLDGGTATAGAPLPQTVQTNQIIFSHSGQELLLTTGTGAVKILSYPEMEHLHTLNAHTSACLSLELDTRGRHLAIGGGDSLASIWDTWDWVSRHTMYDFAGPVRSISFSFDGSYVCGGCDEGTGIQIAHVESGDPIYEIPTSHTATYVAWHPQRYWLAYSGDPMGLSILGPGSNHL